LTNAATVGDTITTISFYVSSVLNAIPATAGSVSTSYLVDGSVTQTKLGTGVAGNGPAFSAYQSVAQSLTSGSTKITFTTEDFDTASCYDTTLSRFLPTVAGYYQINARVRPNLSNAEAEISLTKNGSGYRNGSNVIANSGTQNGTTISCLMYLNGSTDYVEVNVYVGGSCTTSSGFQSTWFNGFLARSA
jgi:hypothetical protein